METGGSPTNQKELYHKNIEHEWVDKKGFGGRRQDMGGNNALERSVFFPTNRLWRGCI